MAKTARAKFYSIPENYEVREVGGLKGLVRKTKKGEEWVIDPMCLDVAVAKCMGKILIAYKDMLTTKGYYRIINSRREILLDMPIIDLLFSKNYLYIKTIRPSSGQFEWCKVNEDFQGGKFLGDFDVLERFKHMPFHIPDKSDFIVVETPDGVRRRLYLKEAVLEEIPIINMEAKQRYVVESYKIGIDEENNQIHLYNAKESGNALKSYGIGEIRAYKKVIESILGGFENVPKDVAEPFFNNVVTRFESFGNFIGLIPAFEIAKMKSGENQNPINILKHLVDELNSDWYEFRLGSELDKLYGIKAYIINGIVMGMVKLPNGKITTAAYKIRGEDNVLDVDSVKNIVEAYKATGSKLVKIKVRDVKAYEIEENNVELMPPYSVVQRKEFSKTIKEYGYNGIAYCMIEGDIIGVDNKIYGPVKFGLMLMKDFSYLPKKKQKVDPEWIRTNIHSVMIA